jgi:hypothetical protein
MFSFPQLTTHFPRIQGSSKDDMQLQDLTHEELHMWISEHDIVDRASELRRKEVSFFLL